MALKGKQHKCGPLIKKKGTRDHDLLQIVFMFYASSDWN